MTEHSKLPWEKFGMGDIMSKGPSGYRLVKTNYEHAPLSEVAEREANAAFIVKAVNSHDALIEALQFIADGYANQDVNHVDYRVKVYQVAREALAKATA